MSKERKGKKAKQRKITSAPFARRVRGDWRKGSVRVEQFYDAEQISPSFMSRIGRGFGGRIYLCDTRKVIYSYSGNFG